MWRLLVLAVGLLLAGADHLVAQPLTVAAASDLQAVLPGLAAEFEAESGQPVRITFGSSGNFFSQIQNGAPFDVFLSADVDYPRRLAAEGKADAASIHTYAVGQLVVWARSDAGVDVGRGLAVVTDRSVVRVAIANPEHAPYGRAAMAALQSAGVAVQAKPKLVLGENVSQAAQFAQSGNAQVGLLPLSLALSPALTAMGRYAPVPSSMHPPILQAAAIVSRSRQKPAGERFLAFLQRDTIVSRLEQAGFLRP